MIKEQRIMNYCSYKIMKASLQVSLVALDKRYHVIVLTEDDISSLMNDSSSHFL